jgi:uncharacterized protein YpuA (DUF1002 family)
MQIKYSNFKKYRFESFPSDASAIELATKIKNKITPDGSSVIPKLYDKLALQRRDIQDSIDQTANQMDEIVGTDSSGITPGMIEEARIRLVESNLDPTGIQSRLNELKQRLTKFDIDHLESVDLSANIDDFFRNE